MFNLTYGNIRAISFQEIEEIRDYSTIYNIVSVNEHHVLSTANRQA